jgi:hypothetical protein
MEESKMKNFIKRMFVKFSKENKESMDIMCNNPTNDLNSFCSLEYAYMNKRNN